MDELHIIHPKERPGYRKDVDVETPGAAIFTRRWNKIHVTEQAKDMIFKEPAFKMWYKYVLSRIEEP
jgi:hypothetical protein